MLSSQVLTGLFFVDRHQAFTTLDNTLLQMGGVFRTSMDTTDYMDKIMRFDPEFQVWKVLSRKLRTKVFKGIGVLLDGGWLGCRLKS